MSPMQKQKAANMDSWQKADARYKVCPKCKGDGIQVSKRLRHYSQCSQCGGTGWKYKGN